MYELQQKSIGCPYCGEVIEVTIDCSEPNQRYIEDCSVCCRPINLSVVIDFDNQTYIQATHENE